MPRYMYRLGSAVRRRIAPILMFNNRITRNLTAQAAVVTIATSLGLMASLSSAGMPI